MGNILTHGQISGLTNRNHIRLCMRVRLHHKLKPNNYTESCMVNVADRWRERNVCVFAPLRSVQNKHPLDALHPGEVCTICPERDNHYREIMLNIQKSAEVIVAERQRTESIGVLSTTGKGGKNIGCRKQRKLLAKR